MNSSRFRPEFFRTIVHPLMSISVSSLGVLTLITVVATVTGLGGPPLGIVLVVIFAPIVEAAVGNVLYAERAGVVNRLRELVIYLIAVYLLASVFARGPLVERFPPALHHLGPVAAAGVTWLIAYVFHDRLRGRESLLRSTYGKHHHELRSAIIDRQQEMALTVRELRGARSLIRVVFFLNLLVIVAGSLGIEFLTRVEAASATFVLTVFFGIAVVSVTGLLNAFIEEYAANGEGLAVPTRFQRRRTLVAALLIVLVLAFAFGLSRAESLLPLEAIADFFRWLGSLLEREREVEPAPVVMPRMQPTGLPPDLAELLAQAEEREPPLWLRLLVRLLGRVLAAAAIAGAALFIFGPLFSRSFREGLRRFRLTAFLRDVLDSVRRRLRIVGRLLRTGLRRRRRAAATAEGERPEPPRWAPGWRPSARKRRQMDRVVTVFVSVAEWAGKHGHAYRRSLAAQEYLMRIAELYPERYPDFVLLTDSFYRARFSRDLLSFAQMREYVQAARRIVRTE